MPSRLLLRNHEPNRFLPSLDNAAGTQLGVVKRDLTKLMASAAIDHTLHKDAHAAGIGDLHISDMPMLLSKTA
jgi:hypothetical protein